MFCVRRGWAFQERLPKKERQFVKKRLMPAHSGRKRVVGSGVVGKGASKQVATQTCLGVCSKQVTVASTPDDATAMSSVSCNLSSFVAGGAGVASAVGCKGARTFR